MSTVRRIEREVLRRRVGNKALSRHYRKLKNMQKGVKSTTKSTKKKETKKSVLERIKELIRR